MSTQAGDKVSPKIQGVVWQSCMVFAIALLVRFIGNSTTPIHPDELLHLLAGQSWAAEGTFRILDGEYLRARGYTMLTGLAFELFGRSDLFVARLPAILAGAVLVASLFYWLYRVAGAAPAWVGALLFCFVSYSIVFSQFTRFYALQALLVWLGSILVYKTFTSLQWTRALLPQVLGRLLLVLFIFAIALHLQVSSAIAMVALGTWVLVDSLAQPWAKPILQNRQYRPWLISAGIALLALGLIGAWMMAGEFRAVASWNDVNRNNVLYYFIEFFFTMPLIWLFLPLAFLLAVSYWPRPALFCLLMTAIPLVIHSFGGMKGARYVFYTMPYLFALWGMAIAVLWPMFMASIRKGVDALQLMIPGRFPAAFKQTLVGAFALVIIVGAIIMNSAFRDTIKSLKHSLAAIAAEPATIIATPPDPPWDTNQSALREVVGQPSILIVGDDLSAASYIPDFDLLLNTFRVMDAKPPTEFALDRRTGRKSIMSGQTLAEVINCYPDGVIVIPDKFWRDTFGISDDAADTIERMAQPVTPAIKGFHIYKWRGSEAPDSCGAIWQQVKGEEKS